jgi:hypothetical protein
VRVERDQDDSKVVVLHERLRVLALLQPGS